MLKKCFRKVTATLTAFLILAAISLPSIAAISEPYRGYYYCTDISTNYLLFFTSATESVFRGSIGSNVNNVPQGVYACSDFDAANSSLETGISTDNMILKYDSNAILKGDSFVPKSGSMIIVATSLSASRVRIKGIGRYYYYEK